MAVPGQEIANPEIGERLRFLQTAADTGGELLETEQWLRAGGGVAIRHRHPRQEEQFEVLSGEFSVECAGEVRVLGAGESITIPPNVSHRFWNQGEGEVHFIGRVRPPLGTAGLFEDLAALAARHNAKPGARLGLLTQAPVLYRYRREVAAPGIPLWVQRPVLGLLALVAGATGRAAKATPAESARDEGRRGS